MKTTPLYEVHRSLGAKFVETHGWEVPAHYGDPVLEHLAVRKGAGIMDASHRGKVRISGRDRTLFLQKILSQDINRLTPGGGAYSTLLDVKGRMLAYMRIYCDEESFLIDTEPGLSEQIVQILTHYLFREDVRVEEVTERFGLLTLQGPLAKRLLSSITEREITDIPECGHLNLPVNAVDCKVVRTSYTGEEGYDIYPPWNNTPALWEGLFTNGRDLGIRPFGLDAFNTLRIEAGFPLYSVDMDEHTIPVEVGLDKAISYDKGCYVGQETISRIKFRGHVNRTFRGFVINPFINNPPIPVKGDRVYKVIHDIEHDVGVITSGCLSPTLSRPIALGYLRVEQSAPGEIVFIDRGGQRLTAAVTSPPFVHGQQNVLTNST